MSGAGDIPTPGQQALWDLMLKTPQATYDALMRSNLSKNECYVTGVHHRRCQTVRRPSTEVSSTSAYNMLKYYTITLQM